jgi:23S rRNA pseudouridine955/2504/2580 synthase
MSEPARTKPHAETQRAGVRQVEVDVEREGQRLDNFLFRQLKGIPKSAVYRLLRSGQVRVNGKRAKPENKLQAGDVVRIPPVHQEVDVEDGVPSPARLARLASWVIFEDKRFLVLNKPSGVAAHGGSGISLGAIEMARHWKPELELELAHRLDRDTSGVLVLCKKHSALRALQALIRDGRTDKRYLCLLSGRLRQNKIDVQAPLLTDERRGGERVVRVDRDQGKPSRSVFRVISHHPDATLCEVELDTGRTHQIRVHAAHIGHPVLGDDKYGDEEANRKFKSIGLRRLFLHARSFAFSLPDPAGDFLFNAPLPPELQAVLDQLESASPAARS